MRIYIFDDVEQLTENYHSGGGLAIVAESVEHAKELIVDDSNIEVTDENGTA